MTRAEAVSTNGSANEGQSSVQPEAVRFDEGTATWTLTTPRTSYAMRLVDDCVWHVYWGPRLPAGAASAVPVRPRTGDETLGEELPGEGGERFGAPSLQVELVGGARALEWRYRGHGIDDGHLVIRLADRHHPLELELHYRVRAGTDVVERWAVLANTGDRDAVDVLRLDSAAWTLPPRPDYRLSHVAGEWSAEFQLTRVPAPHGEHVLTSRRGISRHQVNPWLMVDAGGADEEHGEVWSTALGWSGTWRITTRRTLGGDLTVAAGAGHEGVARRLGPGERFETPVAAGLYAADGFGGTSRSWHSYQRGYVLPHPGEPRAVLYNSWEGTWFDLDEANQRELADVAAAMGVELYVVDDGWFGGRTGDAAGLGDWWPNPDRFPGGLAPLIAHVHDLGMRFGLWVEPEMVNPDSELYRTHPDWVLHMPHRRRTEIRNQLVLNLARDDVADWTYGWLDRLVTDHDIDFLKWDMNRAFTEAGWPESPDAQRLWFGYTENVYSIIDRLRAAHPALRIESCASGGGRADLGILRRADQVWTSDNTDPVDRIPIQHGYTQVYPAITMGAWASESPNPLTRREAPLRFRFHVAMAGALGVSGNLRNWSAEDRAEAATLVGRYKEIRHLVQHGALYRLTPADAGTVAVQYGDAAELVVLAWRPVVRPARPTRPVRLAGLEPDRAYRVVGAEVVGGGSVHQGAVLLHHGLDLDLPDGDYASTLVHLRAV
jgi:alpha-galactosidase